MKEVVVGEGGYGGRRRLWWVGEGGCEEMAPLLVWRLESGALAAL